jgi:ABC-2 type transport system permease protein
MLRVLLSKDLRRAWRNPTPWLVFLAMPLLITALIGLAFGGSGSGSSALGRIQLAVVDEDDSILTGFLRGAMNQGDAGQHLDAVFLDRTEALRRITDNKISAVLIIPAGFTSDYFTGNRHVSLELIKNPAQSYHPAIVEEFLAALVTFMNALARNLQAEFPEWRDAFNREDGPDARTIAALIERSGERLEAARDYLFPPLIGLLRQTRSAEEPSGTSLSINVFSFLLPGLAAMFLLFLADNAVRDLYRERRFRTFERFQATHHGLLVFVVSKSIFAMAIVLIGSCIMFGGGSILFQFRWQQPLALGILIAAYALFGTGFMALLAAIAGRERLADVTNTVTVMALGMIGGCMFPADQMPAFLRLHVTPLVPTAWFVNAARQLQSTEHSHRWLWTVLGLSALGASCLVAATILFRRQFERGVRS